MLKATKPRPIGDLTQKGRRLSMIQLEKDWNSFHSKEKDIKHNKIKSEVNSLNSQCALSTSSVSLPHTPNSLFKLQTAKKLEEEKIAEKKVAHLKRIKLVSKLYYPICIQK